MRFVHIHRNSLIMVVAFIVSLALCLPGLPAMASGAVVVAVSAPAQAVAPGSQFTVNINVTPNNSIAGAQFNLSFNPSLVTINSVMEGNLLKQGGASTYFSPGTINNTSGTLTGVASAIVTPGQTVSTAGTMAAITMTAGTTKGTGTLTLSNVIVGDINGQSLTVSLSAGQVSVDNAPVLTSIGSKTVNVASVLTFVISATDADNDTLTYSASNLPSGAAFNASTRTFTWTPSLGQVGTYNNVTFSVTDGMIADPEAITITVNKLTPAFSSLNAPSINYGTTPTVLGGNIKSGTLIPTGTISITLNGVTQTPVIDGSGNFSSSFVTGSLAATGSPYAISYIYAGDANFTGISDATKTLTVSGLPATITLGNLNQTYDGTAKSVTYTTSPTGLAVSITYNGSGTAPTAAGTYSVVASVTTANYTGSASGTLTIAKVSPVYSNLSAPTINSGTTPTVLGGTIKSGTLIPPGTVSITLNGVTQTATIDGSGNFSSSFVTGSLASGSPYTISYVYAGNTNFNNLTDTSKTLSVYQLWDVNMDGAVNVLDMISVSQHMGETGTAGWIRHDILKTGQISVLDLIIIGQHWTG